MSRVGASGFGAGIVRKFAAEGAKVMVADLNLDLAEEIAAEVGGLAIKTDVSSNDSVSHLADVASSLLGGVDILVNNAGITHLPKLMQDVTEEEFDRVLAVNCKSVYLTAKHFVPAMTEAGKGRS